MQQLSRRLTRALRDTAALLAVLAGAGRVEAQGTAGKIEGTVRDQAGAAVGGAQILIVGSAFSSVSNEQGYYFINNVPAGVMTVRAQYIGYAPTEARGVRVLAGQTMTVNLQLEQRAVEVGGITVVAEANPIVPRDQVTSKPIVQGDVIEQLPVDNIQQMLRLQPGVVESNRGISIRGGRVGEAALYIDGVLVRSLTGNATSGTVGVGTNALEEASVTTGAIGAEMGDAQSGVISLVTRSGGQNFRGSFSLSSDEVSGATYGTGNHRLEASLGGPLLRNLTFFTALTLQGAESPLRGKGSQNVPLYVLGGVDTTLTVASVPGDPTSDSVLVALPAFTRYTTGSRRPDEEADAVTLDTKLQYSYGAGSRLSATYHRTRNQFRTFRGAQIYNAMAQRGQLNEGTALILNWSQNLARSSERALFLEANLSWQRDESVAGLLDQGWFNDHRDPSAGFTLSTMRFVTDLDNFPIDDALVRNLRVNNCQNGRDASRTDVGGCVPFLGRNDLRYSTPYRTNPYGVTADATLFSGTGLVAQQGGGGPALNEETRLTGRVNLDWQANRYNRVRVGGDFVRGNAGYFASPLVTQIFMEAIRFEPTRLGLYATDRLDLGDVVIDLGLRYDRLNSGILYPRAPGRVFSDPLRVTDGDLPRALSFARTAEDSAVAQRCNEARVAADTTAWSTCNYFAAGARGVLSPSLRVSFPVTDRTGFRLSYAHQVQTPNFGLLSTKVNTDLAVTNTNDIFGRDLDFGKSILFEFGIRHAFSDDMVLDVSAYNKDKLSDITARIVPVNDLITGPTTNLNLLTNADFGNVRGVDVKLDRRIGSLFAGSVAYTFQSARSTGSDPFEYIGTLARQISSVTGDRAPPPQALLTTRDNRTHTIAGNLSLNFPHGWRAGTPVGTLLQDMGLFATFRFASGLAYTRIENTGAGIAGPGNPFGGVATGLETLNSSVMPWIRNVDLRLTRGFRFGARDLTVFADFRNLFNFTNLVAIYAETGDITNDLFRTVTTSPIKVTLAQEAGSLVEHRTLTENGMARSVTGVNLTDCSLYNPTAGSGLPNCVMLRRTEARFGNGDGFFTEAEQDAAFNEYYALFNGPQTLTAPGFNFRLGFELNF